MKKIIHSYGVELDWVEPFASALEGSVEGNFIKVPDHIHTGKRYVLNCDFGISALYIDVMYHSEIVLRQVNKSNDFVGIYYNLNEGEAAFLSDDIMNPVGKWSYNLGFFDSTLCWDYIVKPGSQTFALLIFIKKDLIKEYFKNNPSIKDQADDILNPEKNTIIKLTRMSNESYHLLMNLRSQEVGGTAFDFHLRGTVQSLLAEYIEKMAFEKIVIDKVSEKDLIGIISSQAYLVENLDKTFPGIELLAKKTCLSPSKYKSLFRKITGLTPNAFFMNNKLQEAKRLLVERRLNIVQTSTNLCFANNSYFTVKFKEFFGMSPKDFIKQL